MGNRQQCPTEHQSDQPELAVLASPPKTRMENGDGDGADDQETKGHILVDGVRQE
jgi:hypothetical protein